MKTPSNKIIALIFVAVLGTGIGATLYYQKSKEAVQSIPTITPVAAVKKDISISLGADGKVDYSLTNLKFSSSGILKEIFIEEGQTIRQGDILARLDQANLENLVKQAEANYNSALAKYQKLLSGPSSAEYASKKVSVDNAANNLKVQQVAYDYKVSLYQEDRFSETELLSEELKLEGAKAQLTTAQSQLELLMTADPYDLASAKETVNQMGASLAISRKNLADATLVAPMDGVVFAVNGKVGEFISSSGLNFVVLADSGRVTVTANVIEDDISKITVGQDVDVEFTAFLDQKMRGKVTSILPNPVADQSGIVTYEVVVTLTTPDPSIKNGMTAGVEFISQQVKDVVTIPVEAVTRVDGAPTVEVQNPDGTSQLVKVKTGLTDGKIVEIKEGIQAGIKVLIRKIPR